MEKDPRDLLAGSNFGKCPIFAVVQVNGKRLAVCGQKGILGLTHCGIGHAENMWNRRNRNLFIRDHNSI